MERNHHPLLYPQQERRRLIDPAIWGICAGTAVHIPAVQSVVYYFPQGNLAQASSTVSLSPRAASKYWIRCRVLEVLFLADIDSDEVFAKIRLEPIPVAVVPKHAYANRNIVSFAKYLTPSDVSTGEGFSVPKFVVDSIFPPMDYEAGPPVNNIRIYDIHGEAWEFCYVYRGTSRRHLLTTGWSPFVNSKKLIPGDAVFFMRDKLTEELFVGIRRAVKFDDGTNWAQQYAKTAPVVTKVNSYTRNGRGRVPAEVLLEGAERAVNHWPFEVVYFPQIGSPDFMVAAEKVNEATSVPWSAGMRVKMAMETEDSSSMTWFQGTVTSVRHGDDGLISRNFWRMLKVEWDEPKIPQNMKRVSPWQVEVIAAMSPVHWAFPSAKGCTVSNVGDSPSDQGRSYKWRRGPWHP